MTPSRVICALVLALAAQVPSLAQETRLRRENIGYINTDDAQPPSGPSVIWDPTPWPYIPHPLEEIHNRPGPYPPGDNRLPKPPGQPIPQPPGDRRLPTQPGQSPGNIQYTNPYGEVDIPRPTGERPVPHTHDSSDPTGPPYIPWRK
ncbi:uncharacterized protein LOC125656251 isoform X2 [Ostrea edulis]|uniref:uncharacterized protein LOC125656251 isoform X2 n=1 Tax=Ostrea edulis TaxID=37623 RepID=UPI0024AF51F2|nr:uncharacterized protein LOC125656251 isoform X2 [Ostrea edulis]